MILDYFVTHTAVNVNDAAIIHGRKQTNKADFLLFKYVRDYYFKTSGWIQKYKELILCRSLGSSC